MDERGQAIDDLEGHGVLEGFRWAWDSASAQTVRTFDPATGHDQGWLGYNAFKVLTDRLDRVFSCGRFEMKADAFSTERGRLLREGLMPGEFEGMPRLAPGIVVREDLSRSFGWRCGVWRVLLQSFGSVGIDGILWSQKSPTKQRVAAEASPDQPQLSLWEPDAGPMAEVDDASSDTSLGVSVRTLFVAHGIDASTGDSALYLGRARCNRNGDSPWVWRVRLDHEGDDDRPDEPRTQRLDVPSPGGGADGAVSRQLPSEEDSRR
ncbi:hypothetical protein [Actinopolymorpha pittospori]|uniref:Uncharacterized protein n=1 Tax=Actinopolymorpha pittospori TaxID=648752 RepID=A0A927N172_9ACTN|nr:hypothetical protein [Actinopolymorpha pittospori]MBE1607062.1 hypothetical protein [Actinopolymorpha pittospori]